MRAVKLIYTNESRGYCIGEEIIKLDDATLWGDEDVSLGDIYREAIREGLGRCESKVWKDIGTGNAKHIGYFFKSTQRYEDTGEPYKRGVWVVVGEYRAAVPEAVL